MKQLTPVERLIVAADFKPDATLTWMANKKMLWDKVVRLAEHIGVVGSYLKLNSLFRFLGPEIIHAIHNCGAKCFADLKLFDIGETLAIDGMFLKFFEPELLTVSVFSGVEAMRRLAAELPRTEILGVSVLTTLDDLDSRAMFQLDTSPAVDHFSGFARQAGLPGLIMSAKEADKFYEKFGMMMTLNCPAIRPKWSIVAGDDQNPDRIMTPFKAIKAGATRIVVGRPITQAQNPYDALRWTIDEIAEAVD